MQDEILFNTYEEAFEYTKKKKCDCKICVRYRAFKIHIETVGDIEAKKFFNQLLSHVHNIEEDLELEVIYQRNLKNTYPGIYREMHTITPIHQGSEKHPEINI